MNARLPDLTRVDLAAIAAAVGVHPDRVRKDWIKHPAWPKGQEVGKGGRLTWAVDELPEVLPRKRGEPVKVKQAVVMYLARQMARAVAAAPDVAHPTLLLPAPGGQSIPAGLPSPADSSPAATGADGLTGGGGAGCALVSPGLLASCGDGTGRNPVDGQASAGKGQLTLGAGSIPATSAIMIL
jgi:hypothetical protein